MSSGYGRPVIGMLGLFIKIVFGVSAEICARDPLQSFPVIVSFGVGVSGVRLPRRIVTKGDMVVAEAVRGF